MDISFLNSSMYYPLRADMHLSMANNGFHTASQLHDLRVVLSFVFIYLFFFHLCLFPTAFRYKGAYGRKSFSFLHNTEHDAE